MPIYEYKCDDCGDIFEELVSTDTKAVPCPKCESSKVHKLISLISAKGISSGCTTCVPSKCSSAAT